METKNQENKNLSLPAIITEALKIPGIKVRRDQFLEGQFKNSERIPLNEILDKGPVEAGITREELTQRAKKIVWERTLFSSGASFLAGLPGGFAMVATIPTDLLQFYSVALRMAQEVMYLYGEKDLWSDGTPDVEAVRNQLLLYCGVMFGVSASASAVRLMSAAIAKQAMKKIPQKALTKTFYYPLVKGIAKAFGAKMTKEVFAKGVSKAIPIVGGVLSGGITLISMRPMGMRLVNTFDKSNFNYTDPEIEKDLEIVENITDEQIEQETSKKVTAGELFKNMKDKTVSGVGQGVSTVKKWFGSKQAPQEGTMQEQIVKAKELLDSGLISEEEYADIKARIIAKELKI